MENKKLNRRTFVNLISISGIGAALPIPAFSIIPGKIKNKINIGVVGTGNRGTYLLKELLKIENVEVPALCDIDKDRLDNAIKICKDAGRKKPEAYTGNENSFKKLMDRDDLDAVIIATYWEWHTPIFVPSGLKIYLGYICSLTYCSIMLVSAFSRWGCLAGGRSPTRRHPHREPP